MGASEGEAFRLAPDDTGRKESTMTHKDEDQTKDDRDACCERADPDEYFGGRAEIISGTIMPGLCAYMINAFNTHIFSVNAKFTANFALRYILRAPIDDLLELLDQYWLMEGRELRVDAYLKANGNETGGPEHARLLADGQYHRCVEELRRYEEVNPAKPLAHDE